MSMSIDVQSFFDENNKENFFQTLFSFFNNKSNWYGKECFRSCFYYREYPTNLNMKECKSYIVSILPQIINKNVNNNDNNNDNDNDDYNKTIKLYRTIDIQRFPSDNYIGDKCLDFKCVVNYITLDEFIKQNIFDDFKINHYRLTAKEKMYIDKLFGNNFSRYDPDTKIITFDDDDDDDQQGIIRALTKVLSHSIELGGQLFVLCVSFVNIPKENKEKKSKVMVSYRTPTIPV